MDQCEKPPDENQDLLALLSSFHHQVVVTRSHGGAATCLLGYIKYLIVGTLHIRTVLIQYQHQKLGRHQPNTQHGLIRPLVNI